MVQFGDSFLYLLGAATIVWAVFYFKEKKVEKKKRLTWAGLGLILLWVILILPGQKVTPSTQTIFKWDEVYSSKMATASISTDYLAETEYYDFSSNEVQEVIKEIKSKARNYEEASQMALSWVYTNVPYNAYESDDTCFNIKASKIIRTRTGQCDTQTIAVITLMRGMGIAARPVGGCIYKTAICKVRQSLLSFMASSGFPVEVPPEPKFISLPEKEQAGLNATSRGGGLHAWGEVWFPEQGWVTFESTTGQIVRNTCYEYLTEMYPDNNDKQHICISTNLQFAEMCAKK